MAKEPKQLDALFQDTLKDIYFAEKKILASLPKMEKAARSPELKKAFEKHRGETEGQVERLEKVFGLIDAKPHGKTCDAIMGIVDARVLWWSTKTRQLSMRLFSPSRSRLSIMKSHATAL